MFRCCWAPQLVQEDEEQPRLPVYGTGQFKIVVGGAEKYVFGFSTICICCG